MNVNKAIRYAHSHSIKPQSFLRQVSQAVSVANIRGQLAAVMAEIHNDPLYRKELARLRKCDRLLTTQKANRGREFQGYANAKECSSCEPYTIGHMRGSESLVSSESFEACILTGMETAETVSRNIADNNI